MDFVTGSKWMHPFECLIFIFLISYFHCVKIHKDSYRFLTKTQHSVIDYSASGVLFTYQ